MLWVHVYIIKRHSLNKRERMDYEMEKSTGKKFVRYKEGAEMYSISQSLFERLAKASGACYKIGRAVIVDCNEFE